MPPAAFCVLPSLVDVHRGMMRTPQKSRFQGNEALESLISDCSLSRHGAFHPSWYWDNFNAQQFSKWEDTQNQAHQVTAAQSSGPVQCLTIFWYYFLCLNSDAKIQCKRKIEVVVENFFFHGLLPRKKSKSVYSKSNSFGFIFCQTAASLSC